MFELSDKANKFGNLLKSEDNFMEKIMKDDDILYIRSMGKNLRVTAIFTDTERANDWMNRAGSNDGVISVFDPFIFTANIYDKGI